MYVCVNYPTKKSLKEAIRNGVRNTVFEPIIGYPPPKNGIVSIEGPWFPKPHKWYAIVTLENGVIVKVK
jgi:hypothetical protein